ncbi:NADP-dependent 3-hydroxy acid dehydrogenase YdfG [Cyclobacterium lianum]|uniref:NADP-dependent 3-hydroxy acid dehydrogenase YdfG n=1 Tax=Cyclobacterium lianum TaxID=388280 RepID=A0A1M7PR90_9BACT|nr:SDR family NAD(P)-dependent oxidoreductase [Cyclobacterium lianum]SHN19836.1 NADP-dependent 3-hydroxy acid dehydrogenase YdfG [Cyclobacterium lianum]
MEKKIAFITGATSGIGRACARYLAEEGFAIVGCGRRKERLEQLKAELPSDTPYQYLVFDVRDKEAVFAAVDSLPKEWQSIDVLINNAGNAHGLDPIHEGSEADWDAMMDINVKGLLYVSKKIIPGMVERKSGQIINIGSTAGKEVYPKGNVYCGSKHAVDAITKGMRLDLNPYGIKVMAINPGLVDTEFSLVRFKGDDDKAAQVYKGFQPLKAEDIADVVRFAITRPPHVVLADVIVLPTAQASTTLLNKDHE